MSSVVLLETNRTHHPVRPLSRDKLLSDQSLLLRETTILINLMSEIKIFRYDGNESHWARRDWKQKVVIQVKRMIASAADQGPQRALPAMYTREGPWPCLMNTSVPFLLIFLWAIPQVGFNSRYWLHCHSNLRISRTEIENLKWKIRRDINRATFRKFFGPKT